MWGEAFLLKVEQFPDRLVLSSTAVVIVSTYLWNRATDGSVTVQAKLGYDMLAIATAFAVDTD